MDKTMEPLPKGSLVSNKGSGWLQAEEQVGQWFAAQQIR